jgi:thiamine biosynthesis lipoprotein
MGMPIAIELGDADDELLDAAFERFAEIDRRFSPYRDDSELAGLNAGTIAETDLSGEFREVLRLSDEMHYLSGGYFDITRPDGRIDPSGVVKGWAIKQVADLLAAHGQANFVVDAGGDIQAGGTSPGGRPWRVGVRNPFAPDEIVKAICPGPRGVATSGSYVRGHHIYDPRRPDRKLEEIVSLTVVAEDVLRADLLATAAFAMGRPGLDFLRRLPDVEAYAIDRHGVASFTPGFAALVTA